MLEKDERALLERVARLCEENKKGIKKIERQLFISRVIRIVYWTVIIGAAIGVFYFIEPLATELINAYRSITGSGVPVEHATEVFPNLGTFFKGE